MLAADGTARPVFVLDDSRADRTSVERAFRRIDPQCEVVTLGSPHELFERLGRLRDDRRPTPSYVLLDVNMPELDGMQVLRRLTEEFAPLPVVMLSGSARPQERNAAYLRGAVGFVEKPFGLDELTERLRVVHRYWTTVAAPEWPAETSEPDP